MEFVQTELPPKWGINDRLPKNPIPGEQMPRAKAIAISSTTTNSGESVTPANIGRGARTRPAEGIPDVVIVAGGQGQRLLPFTSSVPKVLVPVAGIPIIDHQLDWLHRQGVQRVVLCLGHMAGHVERYVRSSKWNALLEIVVSGEGESRLGTAGAVGLAMSESCSASTS